jgi:hypothetical protein
MNLSNLIMELLNSLEKILNKSQISRINLHSNTLKGNNTTQHNTWDGYMGI